MKKFIEWLENIGWMYILILSIILTILVCLHVNIGDAKKNLQEKQLRVATRYVELLESVIDNNTFYDVVVETDEFANYHEIVSE